MIIKANRELIDDYRNHPGLNQSKLKTLRYGIQSFNNIKDPVLYFEEKESFLIGSLVDDILGFDDDYIRNNYLASDIEKPSDKMYSVLKLVYDTTEGKNLEDSSEEILKACVRENYYQNMKPDTLVAKIIKEGEDFYNFLIQAGNKTVLTTSEFEMGNSLALGFKNCEQLQDGNDLIIAYQVPIYFELDGINLKVLLDILVINKKTQKVYVYDTKTGFQSFMKNYNYLGYDIQAAQYNLAVVKAIADPNLFATSELKNLDLTGYTTEFSFLYQNNNQPHIVIEYQLDLQAYEYAYFGHTDLCVETVLVKKERLGFNNLFYLYKWHLENNEWKVDKDIVENNFKIPISQGKY